MTEFKIVPNSVRDAVTKHTRSNPLWNAVREGKTAFVTQRPVPSSGANLKRQGYRLHVRKYEDGFLVWADKIND